MKRFAAKLFYKLTGFSYSHELKRSRGFGFACDYVSSPSVADPAALCNGMLFVMVGRKGLVFTR